MQEQAAKSYPSLWEAVIISFFTILFLAVSGFIIALLPLPEAFSEMLQYLLAMGTVLYLSLKDRKNSGNHNKFVFQPASFLVVVLSVIALFCVDYLSEGAMYLFPMSEETEQVFRKMVSPHIFSVLTAVILAPIFEELIYRGIILEGFLSRYKPWQAIALSSILFGIMHMNIWQFIGAGCDGLLFGWLYHRTRSLFLCIILHATTNLAAVLLSSSSDSLFLIDSTGWVWYLAICIPVTGLLVFCIKAIRRKTDVIVRQPYPL